MVVTLSLVASMARKVACVALSALASSTRPPLTPDLLIQPMVDPLSSEVSPRFAPRP